MPPQTNGLLLRVQDATGGEAVDGPPAPGPDVWIGQAAIYIKERRARRREGQAGDVQLERTLIVDITSPAVDWRIGQFVTYAPTGAATVTGTIALVSRPSIDDPGVPDDLKTARLQLAPG